uniref:Uncharacterized protein n=1 Tax=Anguilla anguilla TaxID=7936 RepID=A0A0E9QZ19_ANGAN
MFTSEISN